ncbi:hypothetical protein [Neogemmobacter tilapiae]|uniref:Uncharacterized protein n=1 Tax=Neogemmobacter tilapiae TaxID=875041 RepID=A0A918WK09_9RHOB|nr:hypothetical protein [Gemmobacter tilapiae]GHC52942.1 hypothetical protein GCM10007315_14420 [Gemmobacter tilapiae]
MWIESYSSWGAILILTFGFGWALQRISDYVFEMKIRLERLSLTYMKIEVDLAAIQDSLLVISEKQGEQTYNRVLKIKNRKPHILKHLAENGPHSSEILRGLQFPDPNADPAFWHVDRLKKLGLVDAENFDVEENKGP